MMRALTAILLSASSIVIIAGGLDAAVDQRVADEAAASAAYSARTEELWAAVVRQGAQDGYRVNVPRISIDPGRGVIDSRVETAEIGDQVRVGRDLILSVLRVAQANAYVFGGPAPASLEKETAVGRYMMAVAGTLAADVPGRSWRVPEISEFYGMSKAQALKLAGDDSFNRLSDYVFGDMMTFILSHEYAHLALGHLRARPAPGSTTFLDQELAADELGARITGQIAQDDVVGATMPILFVLGYYAQKGVPIAEVRELCARSMSVARSDVENFLSRLHADEEVRKTMRENGIDVAAYERAAERMARMEAGCATMVR